VARLGSGTPGTGNFLRGDGSWQTVPASAPSTTDVLNATAGASYEAVGTYTVAVCVTTSNITLGTTVAGSNLRVDDDRPGLIAEGDATYRAGGTSLAGTWRRMGGQKSFYIENTQYGTIRYWSRVFWLRIS
jgi:hypothetical protein